MSFKTPLPNSLFLFLFYKPRRARALASWPFRAKGSPVAVFRIESDILEGYNPVRRLKKAPVLKIPVYAA